MSTIAINAVSLEPRRQGGGETYVRRLVQELATLDAGADRFVIVTGRGGWAGNHPLPLPQIAAPVDPTQRQLRILWEELSLPRWCKPLGADVMHFPYGACPRLYRGRQVITVHDTLRFFFPNEVPRLERAYKAFVEGSIRRNRPLVICVSQTDADAFCRYVGYPRERVHAIHHGVDHATFRPPADPPPKQDLIAWVGRPYVRKNLDLLLRAMSELARRNMAHARLLIIGPSDVERALLQSRVDALGVTQQVRFHPAVPPAQLPALLAPAKMFCYPSRYESFGLPVLEAMACGIACICAEHPVFRELHGQVPLYCDPLDASDLADKIVTLLQDDALRQRLEQAGIQHAAGFTWQRCAQQTREVYRLET